MHRRSRWLGIVFAFFLFAQCAVSAAHGHDSIEESETFAHACFVCDTVSSRSFTLAPEVTTLPAQSPVACVGAHDVTPFTGRPLGANAPRGPPPSVSR